MADNTTLTVWDQYAMSRACRSLNAEAGGIYERTLGLVKARDRFTGTPTLMTLFNANAATDRMHKEGDAPQKSDLTDLNDLTTYLKAVLLNDGTAPAGWNAAKCASVLLRNSQ
jgi:hypothetical protein